MYLEIEGIDGCFKSTVVEKLKAALIAKGYRAETTRQPGGTPIAESLRDLVKFGAEGECPMDLCQFYMLMASRAQLHYEYIDKARMNTFVISDRGNLSSVAYQGYGLGIPLTLIESCIASLGVSRKPDMIICIDIDAETSEKRRDDRGTSDIIEKYGEKFFDRVVDGYRNYENTDAICKEFVTIKGVTSEGYELSSDDITDAIMLVLEQSGSLI